MNLYLRLLWTLVRAHFKPAIAVGNTVELTLRVWPNDVDVNGHMNNGRYLTIIDLALVEHLVRSGLLRVARARGWRPMLGGSIISFRRSLKPLRRYSLRFAMICWDDRWSYASYEFVQEGRTMATGHAKGAIVGREGIVSSNDVFRALGLDPDSPPFPPSVRAWVEATG